MKKITLMFALMVLIAIVGFACSKNNPVGSTADWKTYTNSDYGFAMQYPEEAKGVNISPNDKMGGNGEVAYVGTTGNGTNVFNYGVTFSVLGSANNETAENWYLRYYQDKKQEATRLDGPLFLSASGQVVQLNSYTAYKTSDFNSDSSLVNFYIVRNGSIFKLTYTDEAANDPKWNEHKKSIDQMLSTFHFYQR